MASPESLPKYSNAPVDEVVLGVQFDRFPRFHNGYLGAFWKRLGDGWSEATDAPPLDDTRELFGDKLTRELLSFQLKLTLTQEPTTRIRVVNGKDGDRMVQFQNGRLHLNWLGRSGKYEYPHYEGLLEEFLGYCSLLEGFAATEDLGDVRPNQWELTYVNPIRKGELWSDPADLNRVFRSSTILAAAPIPNVKLETVNGNWVYEILEGRGRLRIQLTHEGTEGAKTPDVIKLALTARGPIPDQSTCSWENLAHGLSLGREVIVRAFTGMTTESAHVHWGLKDA